MVIDLPEISFVAIDPGETTGVVEIVEGRLHLAYSVDINQLRKEAMPCKGNFRKWCRYDLWVIEDFRVYPTLPPMDPVVTARLIGVLEAVALHRKIEVIFQSASLAKQFITDEWLEKLNWTNALKNVHQRDAARHAACYMLRNRR